MSPRLLIHLSQRDKSLYYGFDPLQVPSAGGMRNALRSIARSESGTLINLPGLNPPFLFFVPITVSLQTLPPPSKNKHASNQLACRQPDVSGAREIPVT